MKIKYVIEFEEKVKSKNDLIGLSDDQLVLVKKYVDERVNDLITSQLSDDAVNIKTYMELLEDEN